MFTYLLQDAERLIVFQWVLILMLILLCFVAAGEISALKKRLRCKTEAERKARREREFLQIRERR